MRITLTLALVAIITFMGCSDDSSQSDDAASASVPDMSELMAKGAEIAGIAQGTLLANVSGAIKQGGTSYAVEFCNIEASGLVDSLNQVFDCEISRVTNRRRNPNNRITTEQDKRAWAYFRLNSEPGNSLDTIFFERGTTPIYYKPIHIAMPACMKCHGSRSQDIELATLDKIDSLYPADAAVNYTMGELRGMWKVKLEGQ